MKIDPNLSKICMEIKNVFDKNNTPPDLKIYLLMELATKHCLMSKLDKETFLNLFSDLYDHLEEQGNTLGFI